MKIADSLKPPLLTGILLIFASHLAFGADPRSRNSESNSVREHVLMNTGWRFALGDACDPSCDFGTNTTYFSYLAKAGYGDGAASPVFDDRA